jgi:Predicted nucleotide-binding protein containing TIR-like domain
MARHPSPPPKPERTILTVEQKRRCIDRLNKRIEDLQAFDPQTVQKRFPPEVTALQNAIDEALSAAFGHGTVEYRRYSSAAHLDDGTATVQLGAGFRGGGQHDETHRTRQILAEGKRKSIILLQQAIRALEDEIADQEHEASSAPPTHEAAPASLPRKVFLVHGRDNDAKNEVARFLSKIGLEEIILHERPNSGRHLLTNFRKSQRGRALLSF